MFERPDLDQVRTHLAARDWVLGGRSASIEAVLNRIEQAVMWSAAQARATRQAWAPDERRLDCEQPVDLRELTRVAEGVRSSGANLRTYLLHVLYGVSGLDEYFAPLREVFARATNRAMAVNAKVLLARGDELRSSSGAEARAKWVAAVELRERFRPTLAWTGLELSTAKHGSSRDWETAEEISAAALRRWGFVDVRRTPPGADGGVDLEGRGVVGQVKYHAQPAGREALQRLVGANLHGARAVFFCRAGYTAQAVRYADLAGVGLWTVDVDTGSVAAANDVARQMEQ
ncbi:restriction endonuclease [Cellulosimicrobium funkei]|uniref:restriction endonuclease n=1 Tax=Cellulosimicrobium funkei TaxID=264251 RepID=UPI003D70B440